MLLQVIAALVPCPRTNEVRVVYKGPDGTLRESTVKDLAQFLKAICPALTDRQVEKCCRDLHGGVILNFPSEAGIRKPYNGVRLFEITQAAKRREAICRQKEHVAKLKHKVQKLAWVLTMEDEYVPISDVNEEQAFVAAGGQLHHVTENSKAISQAFADLRRGLAQLEEARGRLTELEG